MNKKICNKCPYHSVGIQVRLNLPDNDIKNSYYMVFCKHIDISARYMDSASLMIEYGLEKNRWKLKKCKTDYKYIISNKKLDEIFKNIDIIPGCPYYTEHFIGDLNE